MLGGGKVKQIFEMKGQGRSIREIARLLEISRNTVRKYVRTPEVPKAKARPKRNSKLDPYKDYILQRLAEGVDNCIVLLREIRARGYEGGCTILKEFVHPHRRRSQPPATVRFETRPGEQAQVDFGLFRYRTPEGTTRWVWAFVMVLSWSRAIYVKFICRADVDTFIRCHINAFTRLGGVPRHCLYDNAKVVVLGRDEGGLSSTRGRRGRSSASPPPANGPAWNRMTGGPGRSRWRCNCPASKSRGGLSNSATP